jgi:hypothetical protein
MHIFKRGLNYSFFSSYRALSESLFADLRIIRPCRLTTMVMLSNQNILFTYASKSSHPAYFMQGITAKLYWGSIKCDLRKVSQTYAFPGSFHSPSYRRHCILLSWNKSFDSVSHPQFTSLSLNLPTMNCGRQGDLEQH